MHALLLRRNLPILLCCLIVSVFLQIGCNRQKTADKEPSGNSRAMESDSGRQILEKSISKYQSASSYSDQATLKLSYRLSGKWVEEYHPQSIVFERLASKMDKLSCKIFNARVRIADNRMTCFVFDLPTGNLDDQVWLNPDIGTSNHQELWNQLLEDPIARHFISGRSEIPVRERPDSGATQS